MGTLFKKRENWYIDYCVKGRRKRKMIGPSKRLAESVLRKTEVEIAENKYLDMKREVKIKFKDFSDRYLEDHAKPNKRSWKTADVNYLKRLVPFFGAKYLFEIDSFMVEKYKTLRKAEVSVASVNRELALLKCMFNRAIDWGVTTDNPVRKVKFFKENNCRLEYLNKEQIHQLLSHCHGMLKYIVVMAINTGMRKGELQNLKWDDVDFHKGHIVIRYTKNGEQRFLPMNQIVVRMLSEMKSMAKSAYIFCGEEGTPYNFRKSFATALKKSGIFGFRFHDLRHTFASHLRMAGLELSAIGEFLGHKSLEMTKRYAHLSPDFKARSIELLTSRFDSVLTPDVKPIDNSIPCDSASALGQVG